MEPVRLFDVGWFYPWLHARQVSLSTLDTAGVVGCRMQEYRLRNDTGHETGEIGYHATEDGLLLFPAYDPEGNLRGWEALTRTGRRRTAIGSELNFCGTYPDGGTPRAAVIGPFNTDRLVAIEAGWHRTAALLSPMKPDSIIEVAAAARAYWPEAVVTVVLDDDTWLADYAAVRERPDRRTLIERIYAMGFSAYGHRTDINTFWTKRGTLNGWCSLLAPLANLDSPTREEQRQGWLSSA